MIETPWSLRDQTGLTDEATLDVLGRVVSGGVVVWLLWELAQATPEVLAAQVTILLAVMAVFLWSLGWFEELTRRTVLYLATSSYSA